MNLQSMTQPSGPCSAGEGEPWLRPRPCCPCCWAHCRDRDGHRAEQGQGPGPNPQSCARQQEGPVGPSSSHPSMGNQAQRAVHTCDKHRTHPHQAKEGCQSLLLTSGCWNTSAGNGSLSPTFHKWRRSELRVSAWSLPGLQPCSCTECSSSWMALQHYNTGTAHQQPRA